MQPLPPQRRGWCPTLDRPMASGDGLLVRIKPPAATLSPEQAEAVAQAAETFGNGIIELTNRANFQLRGLSEASAARCADAMRVAGLALPPALEARRPVLPPPLLGADPGIAPSAAALVAALEHACLHDGRLAGLPAKFTIAVEAGGVLGRRPANAHMLVEAAAGTLRLRPSTTGDSPVPVGALPYAGTDEAAFGLAPPFAQLDAAALRRLAATAAAHGTTIRLSPWRALLLATVPRETALALPGFITDPADPRLRVTACIGAPGCRSGQAPTRALAATLRPAGPVHVSGCTKGCAHPGPAALTLVGRGGLYDLVRDGRATDPPEVTALSASAIHRLLS